MVLLSDYLPVDGGVVHQLVKLVLDGQLEGAGLIALLSVLASEGGFSRAQLQEHDQVWFRESHLGLLAPVH